MQASAVRFLQERGFPAGNPPLAKGGKRGIWEFRDLKSVIGHSEPARIEAAFEAEAY